MFIDNTQGAKVFDPNKRTIILISGKKTSGKSTLARKIVNMANVPVDIHSFADPIKEQAQPTIDYLGLDMTDPYQKETGRPIFVAIGQAGRAVNPDFWIEQTFDKIRVSTSPLIIIDDLRFENEFNYFDHTHVGNDFNVIRVRIHSGPPMILTGPEDISETDLDRYESNRFFDYEIFTHNNDDANEFIRTIADVL